MVRQSGNDTSMYETCAIAVTLVQHQPILPAITPPASPKWAYSAKQPRNISNFPTEGVKVFFHRHTLSNLTIRQAGISHSLTPQLLGDIISNNSNFISHFFHFSS